MLKELAQYVENKTDLTIGTDLFVGAVPPLEANDAAALLETPGAWDQFLPDKRTVLLQVYSRSKEYLKAREVVLTILNVFHGQSGIVLPVITSGEEYEVSAGVVINGPYSLGQDDKLRHEIVANVRLEIQTP